MLFSMEGTSSYLLSQLGARVTIVLPPSLPPSLHPPLSSHLSNPPFLPFFFSIGSIWIASHRVSHFITQAGLKLTMVLLPQPARHWNDRHVTPYLTNPPAPSSSLPITVPPEPSAALLMLFLSSSFLPMWVTFDNTEFISLLPIYFPDFMTDFQFSPARQFASAHLETVCTVCKVHQQSPVPGLMTLWKAFLLWWSKSVTCF